MSGYLSELPTVDCHSHISPDLDSADLRALHGAVVFAVTRSLVEARVATARHDAGIVWGCGVHPRVAKALREFTRDEFTKVIADAALVGEVGLDAKGDRELQSQVFRTILSVTQSSPRLLSIHSTGRVTEVLDALTQYQTPGAILHWFTGSPSEARRAIDLGCHFSVNVAMTDAQLKCLPRERVVTETDFPLRSRATIDRPGDTVSVEKRLASLWGLQFKDVRVQVYRNLKSLCMKTGAIDLLPEDVADTLLSF